MAASLGDASLRQATARDTRDDPSNAIQAMLALGGVADKGRVHNATVVSCGVVI
jgi:hypothetical protein